MRFMKSPYPVQHVATNVRPRRSVVPLAANEEPSLREAIFLAIGFFRIAKGIGNARNYFDRCAPAVAFGRLAGLAVQQRLGLLPIGHSRPDIGGRPGARVIGPNLMPGYGHGEEKTA
jgi:hypothetical protein